MHRLTGQQTASLGTLEGPDLARVIERLPVAVSTVLADGSSGHANKKAMEIFERVAADPRGTPLGEVGWELLDADGKTLDPSLMPSEITRKTGEELDNVD